MNEPEPGAPRVVSWLPDRPGIRLLDQTRLPDDEVYLELDDVDAVAESIESLRVRGAPAIGITAAMGVVVGLARPAAGDGGKEPLRSIFNRVEGRLRATRPTGRNLEWALRRMRAAFEGAGGAPTPPPVGTAGLTLAESGARDPRWMRDPRWVTPGVVASLYREAEAIRTEDAAQCDAIGDHGVALIPPEGASVLTHCNAGALATGGIGTALAPLYRAQAAGVPLRVFSAETRPVLQGARLTAWELGRAGVDVTVIPDSAAASLMAEGAVDLVIVGADAVAANGDVVNKIGTYGLAVLASHHGIPFYVALPRSTFDPSLPTGRDVPIEARDPREVSHVGDTRIAAAQASIRNPAFDVTPEHLVTALVTDGGVLRPPYGAAIASLLT